jgi:transcriptional regulator with XRE-family HTH domain
MTGAELKQLRQILGLTQKQMAEKLGVGRSQVAKLEVDEYKIRGAMLKLLERIIAEDLEPTISAQC